MMAAATTLSQFMLPEEITICVVYRSETITKVI
jgi:hypothetical protein